MYKYIDNGEFKIHYKDVTPLKQLSKLINKNIPYVNLFVSEDNIIISCQDISNGVRNIILLNQIKNKNEEVVDILNEDSSEIVEELDLDNKVNEDMYNDFDFISLDELVEKMDQDEIDVSNFDLELASKEYYRVSAPSGIINLLILYNNINIQIFENYIKMVKDTTEININTRNAYSTIDFDVDLLNFNNYESLNMKKCNNILKNIDRIVKEKYKQFVKIRENSIYFYDTEICVSYKEINKYENVYHMNNVVMSTLRKMNNKEGKVNIGIYGDYLMLRYGDLVSMTNKMVVNDWDLLEYIKNNMRKPIFQYTKDIDESLKLVSSLTDGDKTVTIITFNDKIIIKNDSIKIENITKTKENRKIMIDVDELRNAYSLAGSDNCSLYAVDVGKNTWVTECVGDLTVLTKMHKYEEL